VDKGEGVRFFGTETPAAPLVRAAPKRVPGSGGQARLRPPATLALPGGCRYIGSPANAHGKPPMKTIANFDRIGEENAFAVLARANALAAQGKDIINLGIGQPDFRTPDHIAEAAIKAIKDGHHGYTAATGIPVLREAVAADLNRRYGVTVSPEEVMILPGGKPTMFMSILMFGQPGVEIMYPDPGFPIYRSMIEYTGATPVPIPIREENGFAFSAEETLALINDRTRLIIINSPANPTGGVTPKAEVDKFVAGMEKWPDVAIMSDEIYDQLIYDGQEHVTLLKYPSIRDRLILLNGWSKTYAMTGWRLGYAVWPGKLYNYARKLSVNLHSCVNAPTQYAGLAALTGPQDAVAHMRSEFDKRRRKVVEGLNKLPGVSCIVPAGAFYAFPNVKGTGWKAKTLANALLDETGVALIGGPDFGILGEGYIRLSYANSTDNILKALGRMGEFLASRKAA
jgi:aspartate/methionine/tyrosine aminotransferase